MVDSKPVPDPTSLTTEQLNKAIANLQEQMAQQTSALREIISEKFFAIERQLALVEQQRVEQKADTKAAVDAALTAQKEAVKEQTTASERAIAKSEASTTKQLEQLNATFTAAIKAVQDNVSDLKDRIGSIEATRRGGKEQMAAIYALASFLCSIIVIGGALAAVGVFSR